MGRKLFWSSSFIVFVFIMLGNTVFGQELKYPTKPIQLIIPYGPGGTNDIIARIVDSQVQEILKTPIIHINKAGAGGALGAAFVKEEKPDGYTILQGGSSVNIEIPIITPNCAYTLEDFFPIARTAYGPLVSGTSLHNKVKSIMRQAITASRAMARNRTWARWF